MSENADKSLVLVSNPKKTADPVTDTGLCTRPVIILHTSLGIIYLAY